MANNRKAGRSNPDQNLDNTNSQVGQNFDQGQQQTSVRNNQPQTAQQGQPQEDQSGMQNDSSLDADSSVNSERDS